MPEQDERRSKRIEFREPIRYRTLEADPFVGGLACDLSEGGIRFNANDFIPLSQELDVELDLGPERPVSLHGRVAWIQLVPHSDRYQVGLQFEEEEDLDEPQKEVSRYIQSQQNS